MHFLNCYHPVRIVKYGKEHYVPCGKCDYCKHVRNSSMSQRIGLEMSKHKYSVFFTLTYANTFIPKYYYSKELNCLYQDSDQFLHGTEESGCYVDTFGLDSNSLHHLDCMQKQLGFVPVLRRSDLQLFMKRLRRYLDYNLVNVLLRHGKIKEEEKEDFRLYYSFCGEYGPSSFRPHYHGIICFEKKDIARMFGRLLRKSWPFGRVQYRFCSGTKEAKYISEYVNASYRLPEFYQRQEFRPFRLFSKQHPVGLPAISDEEISRIFRERSPYLLYKDVRGFSRKTVLWSCIERKLFPRFVAYREIPKFLRVEILKDSLSYDTYKDYLNSKRLLHDLPFTSPDTRDSEFNPLRDYFVLVNKEIQINDQESRLVNSALYSIYSAGRIIQNNMARFSIKSISDYIDIIDEYLHNVELYKLKQQFEFENTWFKNHPDWLQYLNIGAYTIDDILQYTSEMNKVYYDIKNSIDNSHKNRAKTDLKASSPERDLFERLDGSTFSGLDNY